MRVPAPDAYTSCPFAEARTGRALPPESARADTPARGRRSAVPGRAPGPFGPKVFTPNGAGITAPGRLAADDARGVPPRAIDSP